MSYEIDKLFLKQIKKNIQTTKYLLELCQLIHKLYFILNTNKLKQQLNLIRLHI